MMFLTVHLYEREIEGPKGEKWVEVAVEIDGRPAEGRMRFDRESWVRFRAMLVQWAMTEVTVDLGLGSLDSRADNGVDWRGAWVEAWRGKPWAEIQMDVFRRVYPLAREAGGNRTRAAKLLGLTREGAYRLEQRAGLRPRTCKQLGGEGVREGRADVDGGSPYHECDPDETWSEFDGRGIYLCRVCPGCVERKLSGYRPEVLAHYTQEDVDEPIEPEDWYSEDLWEGGEL